MKKPTSKQIHILIIILGIIWITIPAIHTSIWFDESYSIAIAHNHNFHEIWTIGGHDVHPVLYYWILRIVSLIFGNNILCYRLLSVLAISLLGILGYTHIRKDFGERAGELFSLFTFILPINLTYASEIRMYGFAMLFVTTMAIYAHRIYKGQNSTKNWIIFALFSLMSCYTHYYGLMAAGITNLLLFIWIVKQALKTKQFTPNLKKFIIQAIIQVALYIPWIISLLTQMSQVSSGFWIGFTFPDTLIQLFTFQFTGNLDITKQISTLESGIYGVIFCIYIITCIIKNKKSKNKKDIQPAKLAIMIYAGVFLGAIAVTLIIDQPIIYARYFLVVTGLLIFTLTYLMDKIGNKYGNIVIIILTVIMSLIVNIELIQTNYDKTNKEPINYVKENIKQGDIILYGNEGGGPGSGFVIAANFPQYMEYFYNKEHWGVEEAYKAYGPNMETVYDLDFLQNYTGRIWIINGGNQHILEEAQEKYQQQIKILDQKEYNIKYQSYYYGIALVEKN